MIFEILSPLSQELYYGQIIWSQECGSTLRVISCLNKIPNSGSLEKKD